MARTAQAGDRGMMRGLRERPGFYLAALLLVAALLLGGSGSRPLGTMAIELLAIIVLGYFAAGAHRYRPAPFAWAPLLIVALIILVPLLQLIPLPWETWTALPSRGLARDILTLAGLEGRAMPMSLEPQSTVRSALALLPGAAMLVACLHLGTRDRRDLLVIAVAGALLSAILGAFQYATDGEGTLFRTAHRGFPIGLFSNRNQQADLLLLGMIMVAALCAAMFARSRIGRLSGQQWIGVGIILVFAIATVATTSRMGVLLLPVAGAAAALLIVRIRGRRSIVAIAAALVVAAVALPVLSQNAVVAGTLDRLSSSEDIRYAYWADTVYAIAHYLPVGSGVGSFTTIYQTVEALENVSRFAVNHAHNEYLELTLEAGVTAGIIFLGFLAFLTWSAARLADGSRRIGEVTLARAALAGIVLLMLHSIVDYPLRMLSLATLFGMFCGMIVTRSAPPPGDAATGSSDSPA